MIRPLGGFLYETEASLPSESTYKLNNGTLSYYDLAWSTANKNSITELASILLFNFR
jgi:hypothetical protein